MVRSKTYTLQTIPCCRYHLSKKKRLSIVVTTYFDMGDVGDMGGKPKKFYSIFTVIDLYKVLFARRIDHWAV